MNGTVTGRGGGDEPGGRRRGRHPVQVGHRPVHPIPAADAQPQQVRHPVRAAGVGSLPPPQGHVGGEYALLGGPRGVGVGGVFGRGHPDVQLWDELPRTPATPRGASPTKPTPTEKPKPPAVTPPATHATQKDPPTEAQVLRIGQQLVVGRGTPPSPWEGEGEAAAVAKAARGAPLFGGG